MLIERLKTILGRMRLPASTLKLVASARSTADLARQIDELITANELEFRNLQKEIEALERQETEETSKIRSGELKDRSRKIALMRVHRLRGQQDALESRMRIHDKNMNMHIGLLGKIQSLEAMEMRGLDEQQIDSVALEFEEEFERYSAAMEAGAAATRDVVLDDQEKERELARLEAEILGISDEGEAAEAAPRASEKGSRAAAQEPASPASRKSRAPDRAREESPERGSEETGDDKSKEAAWD